MAELLTRLAGPNWEADFLAGPGIGPGPSGSLATASGAFASPALRAKIGPRASLLGTPRASALATDSPRLARETDEPTLQEGEEADGDVEGEDEGAGGQGVVGLAGGAADAEAVREQVEAVQALIRGMQERMLKRDGELEGIERRAREEAARAGDHVRGRAGDLAGGVVA